MSSPRDIIFQLVDDDDATFDHADILARISKAFPRASIDHEAARTSLRREYEAVSGWSPSVFAFRFPEVAQQKAELRRRLKRIKSLEGVAASVEIPIPRKSAIRFTVQQEPISITFCSSKHKTAAWPIVEKLATILERRIERFKD